VAGPAAYSAGVNEDARLRDLRRALRARPTTRVQREDARGEAAVALIIRPAEMLEVLFIERSAREHDPWSGHIAFPGGRRAPDDADLLSTAVRETEEETGIPLGRVGTVLGTLDELFPASSGLPPIVIAPWVAAVPPGTGIRAASHEVRSTAWIPLPALRDPESASEVVLERDNARVRFPSIVWRDYVIWGITHRILTQFLAIADSAGV